PVGSCVAPRRNMLDIPPRRALPPTGHPPPNGSRSMRLCLAGLLTACSHSENSLLVEATPQMEASTLEVLLLDPKKIRVVDNSGPQPVGPAESPDGTLRVAVEFASPRDVMLHLKASTDSGTMLVATHCYNVQGVVRDHVALLALDPTEDADG